MIVVVGSQSLPSGEARVPCLPGPPHDFAHTSGQRSRVVGLLDTRVSRVQSAPRLTRVPGPLCSGPPPRRRPQSNPKRRKTTRARTGGESSRQQARSQSVGGCGPSKKFAQGTGGEARGRLNEHDGRARLRLRTSRYRRLHSTSRQPPSTPPPPSRHTSGV